MFPLHARGAHREALPKDPPKTAQLDEPEPAEFAELGRLAKQAADGEEVAAPVAAPVPTASAPVEPPAPADKDGAAAAAVVADDAPVLSREEKAKAARERYLARKRKAS